MMSTMSFDFEAAVSAPFRMQPGLRRIAPGVAQLTPLSPGSRHQREKLAVLSAFPDLALLQRQGFDPAPALDRLAAHAACEHPTALSWDGHRAEARGLGVAVAAGEVVDLAAGCFGLGDEIGRCLRQLDPQWRLAGLLSLAFSEDFALVDASDGTIPWMAVALPSHWAPEEKVGRHFAEVHAPVADNALLLQSAQALTRLVAGPQAWERFVWNVTGHPRLHAHPAHVDPCRWPETAFADIASQAWWRTERQTFIPLPERQQAIFTIAVDVQPLASAIGSADRARRLSEAIGSMSAAVLDYRNLTAVRQPLLDWLAARQQE
jgi:hypothetical protein